MRDFPRGLIVILAIITSFSQKGLSAETPKVSLTAEPVSYGFVDGDVDKYEAHHWMKDRYAGGIKDFTLEDQNVGHNTSLFMQGHGLLDAHDYAGHIEIKKKDLGYVNLDYTEFRKYYDITGGVYRRFQTLSVNQLDRDLHLDIGRLSVETGLTLENLPQIIFFYEHDFKDGTKSHLTWTAVKEGAVTRNIGPSWQSVDETVDTFAIRVNHEIKGVEIHGEQKWELMKAGTTRTEKNLATTGVAADEKMRVQDQAPESSMMTTTLGAERQFWNEKGFVSGGYRFARIDTRERESIFETDENGKVKSFTNPKQIRNAQAHNEADSHTWVGSFMTTPWQTFNVITKLKSEVTGRTGKSSYPSDTTPSIPDGIINVNDVSDNESRTSRWGEGISLRYTGIPRTALYNDLEFEQVRNWLSEDRKSIGVQSAASDGEIFQRGTLTSVWRGTWTLGGQVAPWPFMHTTAQVRRRQNNNDYDDRYETNPGTSTARSAFVDWQHISTNEFTTRTVFRFWRWLQPAFRYQFLDQDYFSRFEGDPSNITTHMNSNIYTFDIMVQPLVNLMTTTSFSRQTAVTRTPASESVIANTPAFNAGVNTWMFDVGYAPKPDVILTSTVLYSRADNFNDFSGIGLPLGVDDERVELTVGLKYSISKHIAVEPKYAFYHFKTNPDAEFGDYNAHVIWVDVTITWA